MRRTACKTSILPLACNELLWSCLAAALQVCCPVPQSWAHRCHAVFHWRGHPLDNVSLEGKDVLLPLLLWAVLRAAVMNVFSYLQRPLHNQVDCAAGASLQTKG